MKAKKKKNTELDEVDWKSQSYVLSEEGNDDKYTTVPHDKVLLLLQLHLGQWPYHASY